MKEVWHRPQFEPDYWAVEHWLSESQESQSQINVTTSLTLQEGKRLYFSLLSVSQFDGHTSLHCFQYGHAEVVTLDS